MQVLTHQDTCTECRAPMKDTLKKRIKNIRTEGKKDADWEGTQLRRLDRSVKPLQDLTPRSRERQEYENRTFLIMLGEALDEIERSPVRVQQRSGINSGSGNTMFAAGSQGTVGSVGSGVEAGEISESIGSDGFIGFTDGESLYDTDGHYIGSDTSLYYPHGDSLYDSDGDYIG